MNKPYKVALILFSSFVLASCGGSRELYKNGQFNSSDFEENWYAEWNNVDKIAPVETHEYDVVPYSSDVKFGDPITGLKEGDQYFGDTLLEWNSDYPHENYGIGYGPTKNLTSIDDSFAYGYLSKLYDGRVRCDGFYTHSRVQLDQSGYATYFPKALNTYKYFAFSARGGTGKKYENTLDIDIKVNYHISFFVRNHEEGNYEKYTFNMSNIALKTNAGGRTLLNLFYFEDVLGEGWSTALKNTVAMSFTYELASSPYDDLSADRKDDNAHFALMLYEVMFPDSTWK